MRTVATDVLGIAAVRETLPQYEPICRLRVQTTPVTSNPVFPTGRWRWVLGRTIPM